MWGGLGCWENGGDISEKAEFKLSLKDWQDLNKRLRETYSMPLKLCDLEFKGWNMNGEKNHST